jgi:hypothetical protein
VKSLCATVTSRSLVIDIWSHRLAWPRTEPSQGLNTGSNPVGTTILTLLRISPPGLRNMRMFLKPLSSP